MATFIPATRLTFIAALDAARTTMPHQRALCVADPPPGAALFLSDLGDCGFALVKDRATGFVSLQSVFSTCKGRLPAILRAVDALCPNGVGLDCFEPLAALYAAHGFRETGRIPFDWRYAPDGWLPEYGEPDVVLMHRRNPKEN